MTTSTAEEQYAGRPSSDFAYDEVKSQLAFEAASLLSFSMKRYGNRAGKGAKSTVTTFANWWITRFDYENYFPLQVAIEVLDVDGRTLGRLEADYEICFYSFLNIDRKHFPQLLEELILPYFWESAEPFLGEALFALDFDQHLVESEIEAYRELK